jgi:hypothetical protein
MNDGYSQPNPKMRATAWDRRRVLTMPFIFPETWRSQRLA